MKKFFILFLFIAAFSELANAQGKFSATVSSTGNVVTFKIRPDITTTTGFSGLEFFLRYPTSSAAFSYGTVTVNTADFPGMVGNGNVGGGAANSGAWEIIHNDPLFTAIPGCNVDHFLYTAPATITTANTYTGGVSYDVITVPLIGNPANTVDFQFISDDSYVTSYLALNDQNGVDLLPVSTSNLFYPSTLSTPGANSSTIYYLDLTGVPLPVKFLDFGVTKNNDKALLNWVVENESNVTEKYEILRSTNGVDFTTIKTLQPLFKTNGKQSNTYTFTQDELSLIKPSGIIYFRIKQIDKDGKVSLSDIKNVRLNGKGMVAGVYPNPIKQSANVSFDLEKDAIVILSVTDALGKQLQVKQVQGFKGANIKTVDMSKIAGGNYLLKVQAGDEIKILPIVKATN